MLINFRALSDSVYNLLVMAESVG